MSYFAFPYNPSVSLLGGGLALLLGAIALPACSGEPGPAGQPGPAGAQRTAGGTDTPQAGTLNQLSPRVGLVDRRLQVTITADGVALDPGGEVDFGPGVKVANVAAVGDGLLVELEIGLDAKLGARDVTVGALTATNAFVVAVPLDLAVAGGRAEQGGLVRVDVSNRDRIWFDTERFRLYPLAAQGQPTLIPMAHMSFTATNGSVVLLGDPLAAPGPMAFLGVNDPRDPASATFLTEPDALTVTARKPTALEPGVIERTLDKELETGFFELAAAPPQANEGILVDVHAAVPEGSTMRPLVLAYGARGTISDLLDQKQDDPGFPMFGVPPSEARVTLPVAAATKSYFVVLDTGLGHGPTTRFDLAYTAVRAQIVAEKDAPHDTGANAQNIGSLPGMTVNVPGRIVRGEIKELGESDVYMFSGLSAVNATDLEVSIVSDADLVVRVDRTPTFDSNQALEVAQGGKAGSGRTRNLVGAQRFIRVTAAPDGDKGTGTYTLGLRRVPTN
jgi:hypothetical protein